MRRAVLVGVGCALVFLAVVLAGIASGTWAEQLVLTGVSVLLVTVGAAYLVVRAGRRVHARQMSLLRVVRANHKRASVWNFRVTKALGVPLPAPEPGSAGPGARSLRRALSRAGLDAMVAVVFALVAAVGDAPLASMAFVLMWLAIGIGATGLVVAFVERSVQGRQDQLEQMVAENHKRASVWNFHVSKALGIDTAAAQDTEIQIRPASSDDGRPTRVRRHRGAGALVDSGLFDADHYAALADGYFASDLDAASHYLTQNAPLGLSPSPFLELRTLPDEVRAALRKEDAQPLADLLGDDAAARARGPQAARTAMIAHARGVHEARRLAGPRSVNHWDEDAEATWLRTLCAAEVGELPSVSVVMAVRDREAVVLDAIRSVQAQTHGNWRLFVVDDGSVDGTPELVAETSAADDRITLIRTTCEGVSHARNQGLGAADGEYLAFLDSDNEWVPSYLETMLRGMMRDDLGAAYAATSLSREDGTVYRAYDGGLADLLTLNHIDLNVLVVRGDVARRAGNFDEELRRWVDHDYAIKVARIAEPVLLPFIGCHYDDSMATSDRITVRESEHWQWAVLGRHWVRWEDAAETVSGRLSVVVPTYNDDAMTTTAVRTVLDDADRSGIDVEVIVVDNGSRLSIGQNLLKEFAAEDRVRYQRLPRNLNFAIGCNTGLVLATGELTLFLNNDTELRSGALRRLINAMDEPDVIGAQPLLVYDDETIQTAGTVFTVRNGLPNHLLVGHPVADALPLAGAAFDAVSAAALVVRTGQVRELRGFDPLYVNGMEDVDLCLRAREALGGRFVVVPDAIVTHFESRTPGRGAAVLENRRIFLDRWRGRAPGPQHELIRVTGFELAAVGSDGREVPGPKPILVRARNDTRLRWGIRIASFGGAAGDRWGDTHFAASLGAALERAGHRAVVHRHGAHLTQASAFDDVNLVVRGKDRVGRMPGQVNVLWVISHPDDVTVDEIREYDLVFAASVPWSQKMTERSGCDVRPLLQATDADRFHPDVEPVAHDVPLFIGGNHAGRERRVVTAAIEAAVPLGVYGPGWDDALPNGLHLGAYVPNEELAGYYRGASRVLTDHWEGMASDGFVQNRIFDAVASAARVVSDDVEGIDELFQGAVRTFSSREDLAALCNPASDGLFPDRSRRIEIARQVRERHSFTKRAEELVAAVSCSLSGDRTCAQVTD